MFFIVLLCCCDKNRKLSEITISTNANCGYKAAIIEQ